MSIIDRITDEEFKSLDLVAEGESKEVRYCGNGNVIIKYKPTVYSFTHNRCGIIDGSDVLRLRASKIFLNVIRRAGINHTYIDVNDKYVLSKLVLQKGGRGYVPKDISKEDISNIPVAPEIEVVVKNTHSGTPKHRYYDMKEYPIRKSHPYYSGVKIDDELPYPEKFVRFDWRNPFEDKNGTRLADEVLPEPMADWFIDVKKAQKTAIRLTDALEDFLNSKDIVLYDICLFVAEDGETVFGEISQDCGRYRHFDYGSLDKDVWRSGGSHSDVIAKWELLLNCISK